MLAHWGAFIKGENMIMFDIAEWIINLVVLGLGLVLWCLAILLIGMIIAISNKWVKENLIKQRRSK
tara:strand:+ start:4992 stop:5189 length:198 start_codon:yes stop_codon:yes gene_type:complete